MFTSHDELKRGDIIHIHELNPSDKFIGHKVERVFTAHNSIYSGGGWFSTPGHEEVYFVRGFYYSLIKSNT